MFEFGYLLFCFYPLLPGLSESKILCFLSSLGLLFDAFGCLLGIDIEVVASFSCMYILHSGFVGVFLDRLELDYFIHKFYSIWYTLSVR